jgi:hypothetical protein
MTDQTQPSRPQPAPGLAPQRPISTASEAAASSAGGGVAAGPLESPLAGQLPGWDLLPPASLLLRRRPSR